MNKENRKHRRIETGLSMRFNLNPDYHYVPAIRKLGVAGTVRNVSIEGFKIDARMDTLDTCQIFPEAMEEDSPFELEVVLSGFREEKMLVRGSVKWYSLSEPEAGLRQFEAGLHLKDPGSRAIARGIIVSSHSH
jgi:hypothetical protein